MSRETAHHDSRSEGVFRQVGSWQTMLVQPDELVLSRLSKGQTLDGSLISLSGGWNPETHNNPPHRKLESYQRCFSRATNTTWNLYIRYNSDRYHFKLFLILINKSVNLELLENRWWTMYRTNNQEMETYCPLLESPLHSGLGNETTKCCFTTLQYCVNKYLKYTNKLGEKTQTPKMTNGHFIKFNTILVPHQVSENGKPATSNIFQTLILCL